MSGLGHDAINIFLNLYIYSEIQDFARRIDNYFAPKINVDLTYEQFLLKANKI